MWMRITMGCSPLVFADGQTLRSVTTCGRPLMKSSVGRVTPCAPVEEPLPVSAGRGGAQKIFVKIPKADSSLVEKEWIYYVNLRDSPTETVLVPASKADAFFYGSGCAVLLFAGRGAVLAGEPAKLHHPLTALPAPGAGDAKFQAFQLPTWRPWRLGG